MTSSLHKLSPLWLFFGAALLLLHLNYAPLWNPDEGRYAAASLEMAQPFAGEAPDWIVPHLNTVPRLNKPPLLYWLTATCLKIFGASALTARLTSALAAVGVLLILWRLGRHLFGESTAILAAVIWASSTLPFILAHTLNTDMLLTFCMTLALGGLWLMSNAKQGDTTLKRVLAVLLGGTGLGLAMLTKGPVGVLLPCLSWGLWFLIARGFRAISRSLIADALIALCLSLLIAAPWYMAIARVHPEFLKTFLLGENIARLTGSQFYHKPEPPYFYLPFVLIGLFPWTAFLIPAFSQLRDDIRATRNTSVQSDESTPDKSTERSTRHNRWFLWLWAACVIGLFSISHVKLITYILPAFPALALLLADAITMRARQSTLRALRLPVLLTAALLVVLAIALPIAFFRKGGLVEKTMPAESIGPFVWALCAVAVITACLLCLPQREYSSRRHIGVVSGSAAAIFVVLLLAAGRASVYLDTSPLCMALLPRMGRDDVFVQFKTFQPSSMFYLHRPITTVDVENRSGWDEHLFRTSPRFPAAHSTMTRILQDAKRDGHRVFVLTKWKYAHWPSLSRLQVVAINNDYRLLSNQSAPPGFSYDFTTPQQRQRELSNKCKALSPEC